VRGRLLATILPCLAIILALAASGAWMLVAGRPLLWAPIDTTLSEAVALRDQGEMVRQILNGADPNARYDVVDVIRLGQRDRLTPLEAAVSTRERYMVEVVVGYGGRVDETNARTLYCLARELDADETATYLASIVPVAGPCDGVALPYR
jgi:hypothetical protein